jgi:DNA polymerase elongation subunit (family B)
VARHWDDILVRGYEDGRRFERRVKYRPYLFIATDRKISEVAAYLTVDGRLTERRDFDSIRDAREFLKRHEGVHGIDLFGMTDWQYPYIYDEYPHGFPYDPSLVSVVNLDIEIDPDGGFPPDMIEKTPKAVTAITLRKNGRVLALGCHEWHPDPATHPEDEGVTYVRCQDEAELLHKFVLAWERLDPDVVTGWNVEFFDMPYLINRIKLVLGIEWAKRLSPWRLLEDKRVHSMGREQTSLMPVGVAALDYLALYKKFTYVERESYKLDFIGEVELDEKKLDYSDVGTLGDLYRVDFPRFMRYNVRDTWLVAKLDEKMRLIELVFAMAYDARVNYVDVLASVRPWGVIIHNYLRDRRKVIPVSSGSNGGGVFAGGHVKEPRPGRYQWVASLDFASLYPSLIMTYNIGPETKVTREQADDLLREVCSEIGRRGLTTAVEPPKTYERVRAELLESTGFDLDAEDDVPF